jgi:hypothetical protein
MNRHVALIITTLNLVFAQYSFAAQQISGATVLSVFYGKKGVRKVLISEENVAGSPFYQKYEGWGGSFDKDVDHNEFDTAIRELWEEMLAERIFGWDIEKTAKRVKKNTETKVATNNIPRFFPKADCRIITATNYFFITQFKKKVIKKIKENFATALASYEDTEENFKFREKGKLAVVTWDSLVQAIISVTPVAATVYKSGTEKEKTTIELRSILMGGLRDHFLKHPSPVVDKLVHQYDCTIPEN